MRDPALLPLWRHEVLQTEMGYLQKVVERALVQRSARDPRLYRAKFVVVDQCVRAPVQLQHLPVVGIRRKGGSEERVEELLLLDRYVQLAPAAEQVLVVRAQRVVVDAVPVLDRDRRSIEQLHRAPLP